MSYLHLYVYIVKSFFILSLFSSRGAIKAKGKSTCLFFLHPDLCHINQGQIIYVCRLHIVTVQKYFKNSYN